MNKTAINSNHKQRTINFNLNIYEMKFYEID